MFATMGTLSTSFGRARNPREVVLLDIISEILAGQP